MTEYLSHHCANCRQQFACASAGSDKKHIISCNCIEDPTVLASEVVYHFYCSEKCLDIGKSKKPLYVFISPPSETDESEKEIQQRWKHLGGYGDRRLHLTPIIRLRQQQSSG